MKDTGYALITGGAGFIGSNLADALLADGERVVLLDNFSRAGVEHNVRWLRDRHGARLRVERGSVLDGELVACLVGGAARVFHLAAQVAVTTSIEDPAGDLRTNVLGTFKVLEAARRLSAPPPVLFSSTNKVYGTLAGAPVRVSDGAYGYADGRRGIDETAVLDFHSPYGCSKGAADQYVRDYARIYGVPTVVFRLSCAYGRRQFGTEDQGWVAHFARSLLAGKPITIFGDGRQVRDILYVDDLVRAMRAAMRRIDDVAGDVFNVGGGPENAVSVRQVLQRLAEITGVEPEVAAAPWRPGDQRIYVSDIRKATRAFAWAPRMRWTEGLDELVIWLRKAGTREGAAREPAALGAVRRLFTPALGGAARRAAARAAS
jgi:CDP-paratose 2-epimerase